MTKRVGGNFSESDTSTLSGGIPINNSTSTLILAALASDVAPHIRVIATNDSNKDVWVKFQAASVDNDKDGFKLYANTTAVILELPNIYRGEISAIADSGSSTIFMTSF